MVDSMMLTIVRLSASEVYRQLRQLKKYFADTRETARFFHIGEIGGLYRGPASLQNWPGKGIVIT
jgi:hypothetical protein